MTSRAPKRSCAEWAEDYARLNWSVIPMRPCEKRPAIAWETFQKKRASLKQIAAWFAKWPDANAGIVTGAVSSLVVIDVDPAHGGADSLERLKDEFGAWPTTAEARTGGGGTHFYFAHQGDDLRNRAGLRPGIDVRGEGGCIVAPPSIHPNGRPYSWVPGRSPLDIKPARLPVWLASVAVGPKADMRGHPISHWRALVSEGVNEGARNSSIASLTGHLLWHGVDPGIIEDLLQCWNAQRCRPPLSSEEVSRVVASIVTTHGRHAAEQGNAC